MTVCDRKEGEPENMICNDGESGISFLCFWPSLFLLRAFDPVTVSQGMAAAADRLPRAAHIRLF